VTSQLRLRCSSNGLSELRRTLSAFAGAVDADELWLVLAATELTMNALAVSPEGVAVGVSVRVLEGGLVELTVVDEGPGPPSLPVSAPPPSAVGGRGLLLVQELSQSFWFERLGGRTIARCRKPRVGRDLGGPPDR
jgi:anti-sigma regulatory factor (Ser/Thr protein kinase)